MSLRKWVVRGLVFAIVGSAVAVGFAYQHWTDPEVVRKQVLAQFEERLPGAIVSVESSQFRLLGGTYVNGLHLIRRDDPKKAEFFTIPTAVINHDKEQLANGKLVITKIVCPHPTVRVVRRKDGTWNLANIVAPPDPSIPVPQIVLQKATITIEDQTGEPGQKPLEIKEFDLTITNEPHSSTKSILAFKGSGISDSAGKVLLKGTLDRRTGETTLALDAPVIPVDGKVIERLASYCPDATSHLRMMSGSLKLRAELTYNPVSSNPWSHDLSVHLTKGHFTHAQLPYSMENLEAKLRCVNGQVSLEKLSAQAGPARLEIEGKTAAVSAACDLEGQVRLEHARITPEIIALLPPALQVIPQEYSPGGQFNLVLDVRRKNGEWQFQTMLRPDGMTASFIKFPYELKGITGTIEYPSRKANTPSILAVNLTGFTGEREIKIEGDIQCRKGGYVELKISGTNLPIDAKLRAALDPKFQRLVDAFAPRGFADVEAIVRHRAGEEKFDNQYIAKFHDSTLRYEVFPYPLEKVSGVLEIRPPQWEFRDFHGSHKGAEFRGHGGTRKTSRGEGFGLTITGTNVLLDSELEASIRQPGIKKTWTKLSPVGRINFEAQVEQLKGQTEPELDVRVDPQGASIRPQFFPYELSDMRGTIHCKNGRVYLHRMSAEHGPTLVSIDTGIVTLHRDGRVTVDLIDIIGNPILLEPDLLRALPRGMAQACQILQIKEPISLKTNLTIDLPADQSLPPYVHWDGGVRLQNATLLAGVPCTHVSGVVHTHGVHNGVLGDVLGTIKIEEATVFRQVIRNLFSKIVISAKQPDVLDLPNLSAKLYGGDLGGKVHVEFAPSLRYEVYLKGTNFRLEEFGRMNRLNPDEQLSGVTEAALYLQGQGTGISGLRGNGNIDVPSGKIHNVRLLLDLLKVLAGRAPDKTMFEEAHIQFGINGAQVQVGKLDLIGNAVSLNGQGSLGLDGSNINLDFFAVWARTLQLLPPLIDKIPPLISKQLLRIKVRGSFEKVEVSKEPVPIITEPLKEFLKTMKGKQK